MKSNSDAGRQFMIPPTQNDQVTLESSPFRWQQNGASMIFLYAWIYLLINLWISKHSNVNVNIVYLFPDFDIRGWENTTQGSKFIYAKNWYDFQIQILQNNDFFMDSV
jgi:hypothetical protein